MTDIKKAVDQAYKQWQDREMSDINLIRVLIRAIEELDKIKTGEADV